MTVIFKIITIPYFFLWLWNSKIPVGNDVEIFLVFIYSLIASPIVLALLVSQNARLMKSSASAVVVLLFLLAPTICYQLYGATTTFNHNSDAPTGLILKLTVIVLVFVTFNELLAHKYLTATFLLKTFVISVLLSIPKYLIENYALLSVLDTGANRPFPIWIGGWNTYAFILSLAFAAIYKSESMPSIFRYSILTVMFGVMITTLSRGGVAALAIVLVLDWRSKASSKRNAHIGRNTTIAITMVAIGLIAMAPEFGATIYDRFVVSFLQSQYEGAGYMQSVSSARTVLWLDTLAKICDVGHYRQWLFGYGVGHYAYETLHGSETSMGNQYLLFLYEYGLIVGLALSLFMFRAYSRLRWGSNVPCAQTIKVMCAIFLVSNFVEEFIYTTQVGWIIGVGAAIIVHVSRRPEASLPLMRTLDRRTPSCLSDESSEVSKAWGRRRGQVAPLIRPGFVPSVSGWRLT